MYLASGAAETDDDRDRDDDRERERVRETCKGEEGMRARTKF